MLAVAALALAGCGGSGDSGTTTPSAGGTGSTQEAPAAKPGGRPAQAKKEDKKASQSQSSPSKSGGKQAAKPGNGAKHEAHQGNAGHGNSGTEKVGSGSCPSNITRAQCKAYVEQPVGDAPSHPVNTPESCGQAMTQKACEEQFEAEQAGKGQSVDAERCLEEESRARCEAQLGPQIEAERESRNE